MTFKKRIENLWYYYKAYLIAGIVALVALCIAINSCANRKKYDVNILYMTHGYADSFYQTDELSELFATYTDDVNGDGIANTQIITIRYGETMQDINSANATRSANLAAGKNVLFLVDEQNYTELKNGGFLADISSLGESEYLETDRFCIFDSGILDTVSGFKQVGDQYYLCLRTYDKAKADSDASYKTQYEAAKQLLQNIIS